MKGILLIAAGHQNYFRMALNCAISIKATCKEKIALAFRGPIELNYSPSELLYFDFLVPIEDNLFIKDNKEDFTLLKLNIFNLSPFEETIYIDADSLCLYKKKLSDLFDGSALNDLQFDIMSESSAFTGNQEWDYFWYGAAEGGLKKIRKTYLIPDNVKMFQIQSSIILFKRTEKVKEFFNTAIEIYLENKLQISTNWKGWLLDELMFIIAMGIHRIEIAVPFKKVYYPYFDGYISTSTQVDDILSNYYFYSIPGINTNEVFINLYNELIKEFYRHEKLDINRIFLYENKKTYMPERVSL